MKLVAIGVGVGAGLGFVSAHMLFLQWMMLIPWGLAGFALGYWTQRRSVALAAGATYGLAVCIVFMIAQYTGSASLPSRMPYFGLIGAFGALCGAIVGWIGFHLNTHERPKRARPKRAKPKRA
ncbi:MAG: hypothetical protein ABI681_07795 [Gemmatimonadales bacterium]